MTASRLAGEIGGGPDMSAAHAAKDPDVIPPAEAAFERCFAEHYAAIAAYFLRRCTSREDAEDATTEVFAVAWRRRDDLPAPPEDRLWLFGVARRVLANHARALRRRERLWLRLRDATPAEVAVAPVAGGTEDAGALGRALSSLSDGDRELLLLVAWDGLAVAEVAQVLEIPAPVVSRRLHRARRRLAQRLQRAGALGDTSSAGHAGSDPITVTEATR